MGAARNRERSLAAIGCLILALPFAVVLSPLILAWTLWEDQRAGLLRRRFMRGPGADGNLGILVYSNSPHWQNYIETSWLPRVADRFVILNWSERARWHELHPLEAQLFQRFAGRREFNPLAIIFLEVPRHATWKAWIGAIRAGDPIGMLAPSVQRVRVIRFWQAFRDFKHGKDHALKRAEQELFSAVDAGRRR